MMRLTKGFIMNNRGKVWIIPDEGQIIQPLFERDVALGENHTKKI